MFSSAWRPTQTAHQTVSSVGVSAVHPRTVSLCVAPPRTGVPGIDASRLLSTWSATAQRQAAVKLYGVFACRLKVLDCAPVMSISPDVSWRQWDSRWAIHASRQLSDKVLRYLKRVIDPRCLQVLRQVETRFQIPALSRIQRLYTTFRSSSRLCFY